MSSDRVSVVVVSFNTRDKLRQCLSCVVGCHEVIVVDNASHDGSAEMVRAEFPHVRLIANGENVGFGVANNQGASVATGEVVLYLNSDAYAEPGAVDLLSDAMGPGVAAAGGMLLNPDGSLQESVAGALTLWAVFLEQTMLDKALRRSGAGYWRTRRALAQAGDGVAEVEQVMGACLMVRRGLEQFDERFFLYCEDTELCKRLRRHGRILYVPSARFTHELGSSSRANRWLSVARYNRGKELYFRIHHGAAAASACWVLNRLGALLRLAGWLPVAALSPSKRGQAVLFWRVLTARPDAVSPSR
jgi:N-acetylglucosaminyl-diphospho-decaprenol L-rhamnosyltransferase